MLCKNKVRVKSKLKSESPKLSAKSEQPQVQCCINCGRDTIALDGFCGMCSHRPESEDARRQRRRLTPGADVYDDSAFPEGDEEGPWSERQFNGFSVRDDI